MTATKTHPNGSLVSSFETPVAEMRVGIGFYLKATVGRIKDHDGGVTFSRRKGETIFSSLVTPLAFLDIIADLTLVGTVFI